MIHLVYTVNSIFIIIIILRTLATESPASVELYIENFFGGKGKPREIFHYSDVEYSDVLSDLPDIQKEAWTTKKLISASP